MKNNLKTIIYKSINGNLSLDVKLHNASVWLDKKQIANLFETDVETILPLINHIYKIGELQKSQTMLLIGDSDFPQLFQEGPAELYNLSVILALGYKLDSKEAISFRQWAVSLVREYLQKGYLLDCNKLLTDEKVLAEISKEIRQLRMQKMLSYKEIRGILAKASNDYNPHSMKTSQFYSRAQNLLNYAVTGCTASEIIMSRVDHRKENCGLNTTLIKKTPHSDEVVIAKNYLYNHELDTMHRLVDTLLSMIEWQVKYGMRMPQAYWLKKIEMVINLYGLKVWHGQESILRDNAHRKAREELRLYKQRQKQLESAA